MRVTIFVALLASFSLIAQTTGRSSRIIFEDYAVTAVFHGKPVKPTFSGRSDEWPDADKRFQDSVGMALDKGTNFAGSYTIVETSCGTGCEYLAVVDGRTGRIFSSMPFFALLVGPFRDGKGHEQLGGVEYRLNSRLLIAKGCFDSTLDDKHGYYAKVYYLWTGRTFRRLKRIPLDWVIRRIIAD